MTVAMRRPGTIRIRQCLVTAYARDQVARALRDAVVMGLEFGPHDLPSAGDREWIREAIASPIREATEAALEALNRSIWRALEGAPDALLDRYDESHRFDELGID
jgi:hypothetical protein